MHPRLAVFVLLFALVAAAAMASGEEETAPGAIRVVASIKPVHSLVSAIMDGVGEPHLIIRGASSPHTFSMRPSDAEALEDADAIFLIDERKETALAGPIANLGDRALVVRLSGVPGITLWSLREGGAFEMHTHGHGEDDHHDEDDEDAHEHDEDEGEHGDHEHGEFDMHIWLDPVNAAVMAEAITDALSEVDPANAATYHDNEHDLIHELEDLVEELDASLAPIRDRPFIVLHDAYRYFEDRFGLNAAGSITVNPERAPGVQRVTEIRDRVRELEGVCVFAEPQFDRRIVDVVVEGTQARAGTIDPLGADIDDGPELYFKLMRTLAASFNECLGATG
ncbi:MAG: zinc ABC transporter substrate-binding protein [Spirochaetaceae bacterium]|nr:zinc ABC transporter substrate-binding protein [Spirochaetaceae bacterium]